ASPNGSPSKYGYFPPIQTAILAFGSIPVTATVQLVQPFDKAGDPVSFLIFGHGLANFPYTVYPTKVSGDVQLHLSNVTVDQVPLDVGAHCQLKTPMHMLLYGDSPAYNLFTGGPLAGTATIPAFTGCQSGGQDLDPLITGMISGPNTQLSLRQGALGAWIQPNGPCGDPCGPPHS
ncbi:MAG: hypothetical protein ABI140_07165, partial [Jatrophihabitantaceae bacterium]